MILPFFGIANAQASSEARIEPGRDAARRSGYTSQTPSRYARGWFAHVWVEALALADAETPSSRRDSRAATVVAHERAGGLILASRTERQ